MLDVALAGQQHALDGQDLAADLGPGQAGDDADHVLGLGLAEAELAHAGVLLQVLAGDRDLLGLLGDDLLHRLARQVGDLALQVPHAGFARVVADQVAQRVVGDLPLVRLQAVRLGLLGDQVALGDLDLLILGVAGDADDLHAVHQRLRHAQAVGRGDEHHVRQVVVHLQIVVVEGASSAPGPAPRAARDDGSPRQSAPSLSTSSSRNSGLEVFAFFMPWMTLPGIEPI